MFHSRLRDFDGSIERVLDFSDAALDVGLVLGLNVLDELVGAGLQRFQPIEQLERNFNDGSELGKMVGGFDFETFNQRAIGVGQTRLQRTELIDQVVVLYIQ